MTDVPIKVKISSGEAATGKGQVVRLLQDIRNEAAKTNQVLEQIGPKSKKSLDQASSSALGFKTVIASIFTAATVSQVIAMADSYTNLQNRLRLVTSDAQNLAAVTQELFNVSNQTRSSYESTAELFARVSLATKDLGISQQATLDFTKSLNQAVILSGASAQEAQAGIIQLSQGLASGTLRGDELRSVLEQLPAVADVIAKGMGVTRGELRKLGEDGKITAKDVIDSFSKAKISLEKDFGSTVPTIGQSFVVLRNNVMQAFGEFDQATGISKTFSQFIMLIANNLDVVGKGLAIVGAIIAGSMVPSIIAASKALWAMTAAAAANPFVLLAVAITSLVLAAGGLSEAWQYLKIGTASVFGELLKGFNIITSIGVGVINGFVAVIEHAYEIFYQFGVGLNNFVNDPFAGSANFSGLKATLDKGFVGSFREAFDNTMLEADKFNKSVDESTNAIVDRAVNSLNELKNQKSNFSAGGSISTSGGISNIPQGSSDAAEAVKKENEYLDLKKQLLENIKSPHEEYLMQLQALNELQDAGTISNDQYNESLAKILENWNNAQVPTSFSDGFTKQLNKMMLETRNATAQMGTMFASIFGPGGTLSKGIGDAVAQSLVFGKSWKESIADVAKSILAQLISSLVQIGVNMLINAVLGQSLLAASTAASSAAAAATASAWAPAAAMVSLASFGANSGPATMGITATNAAATSMAAASKVGAVAGFESGGYTGNGGISDIAGVVHGQEFVMNASATKKNRAALEAMNNGQSLNSNGQSLNVNIINQAGNVEFETNQLSNGDVEIIARRVVQREAPSIIASDIANPNGKVSKSLVQNTKLERKRV